MGIVKKNFQIIFQERVKNLTSIWLNFKVEHMWGRLQLSRTVDNHRRPNLPLKVGFCTCAVLLAKYHWEQLLLINWRTQSTYSLHDHEHYAARSDFSCDDLMMHLRHYLTKRRISQKRHDAFSGINCLATLWE